MLNTILTFFATYKFEIFAILCLVIFIILLGWQRTKEIMYQLMLQAKRMAKQAILNSGQAQEDWVVKMAMAYMPVQIKLFLSEDMTRKIIKWLYQRAKDYADDGVINNSV